MAKLYIYLALILTILIKRTLLFDAIMQMLRARVTKSVSQDKRCSINSKYIHRHNNIILLYTLYMYTQLDVPHPQMLNK